MRMRLLEAQIPWPQTQIKGATNSDSHPHEHSVGRFQLFLPSCEVSLAVEDLVGVVGGCLVSE